MSTVIDIQFIATIRKMEAGLSSRRYTIEDPAKVQEFFHRRRRRAWNALTGPRRTVLASPLLALRAALIAAASRR
jgi:hypothetical protein